MERSILEHITEANHKVIKHVAIPRYFNYIAGTCFIFTYITMIHTKEVYPVPLRPAQTRYTELSASLMELSVRVSISVTIIHVLKDILSQPTKEQTILNKRLCILYRLSLISVGFSILSLYRKSYMTVVDHYDWPEMVNPWGPKEYLGGPLNEGHLDRQHLNGEKSHKCGYSSLLYRYQQYRWSEENITSFSSGMEVHSQIAVSMGGAHNTCTAGIDMWITVFPYDVAKRKSDWSKYMSTPYHQANLHGYKHSIEQWTATAIFVQDPEPQIQRQMNEEFPEHFSVAAKEYVIPIPPLTGTDILIPANFGFLNDLLVCTSVKAFNYLFGWHISHPNRADVRGWSKPPTVSLMEAGDSLSAIWQAENSRQFDVAARSQTLIDTLAFSDSSNSLKGYIEWCVQWNLISECLLWGAVRSSGQSDPYERSGLKSYIGTITSTSEEEICDSHVEQGPDIGDSSLLHETEDELHLIVVTAICIYVLISIIPVLDCIKSPLPFTTFLQMLRTGTGTFTRTIDNTATANIAENLCGRYVIRFAEKVTIRNKLSSCLRSSFSSVEAMASSMGLHEPVTANGKKRLRWRCNTCDASSFDDIDNYTTDHLENSLNEPLDSAKPTVETEDGQETPQQGTNAVTTHLRRLLGFQPGTDRSIWKGSYLPRHNLTQSHALRIPDPLRPPVEPLYLLVCMHADSASKKLSQLPVESLGSDRELFRLLNESYLSRRGKVHSMLSMQKLCGIHFVKFSLLSTHYVDVHQHEMMCKSTCGCLPPREKIDDAEYKYYPIPPERSPPIGPNWMAHLTTSPRCVPEGQTWMLTQIPKKLGRELHGSLHSETLGWGLYLQEGLDWSKIWTFMLVVFVTGSLVFAILWTVFKHDVQGAFGVASWLVSLCTILVGFVATRDMV